MKKLFILLLLMPFICFADVDTKDGTAITTATNIDGFSANIASYDGQTIASAGGDPTPDFQISLDDNTSGTTVVATYGTNAVLLGVSNSSDVHNADAYEGTGSFALLGTDDRVASTTIGSQCQDGVFTIQFTIKGDGSGTLIGSGFNRLLQNVSGTTFIIYRYNSDTTIRVLTNAAAADFTVDDIDDGQWHSIRVVCDSGEPTDKVKLYQKTGAGTWSLKGSSANLGDISGVSASISLYGEGSNPWANADGDYKCDVIYFWNSAVSPI